MKIKNNRPLLVLALIPIPDRNASNLRQQTIRSELVEGCISKVTVVLQAHHKRVKLLAFLSGN